MAGRSVVPQGATATSLRRAAVHASIADDPLALYDSLKERSTEDDPLGVALRQALDVCSQSLRLYGPDAVVTSFNGGKDAVVIMHLMRAALAHHNRDLEGALPLRVIFFEQDDEFVEVDAFTREMATRYKLKLLADRRGFAEGLEQCIANNGSRAFVLGTRHGDPNAAGQEAFAPSSTWMPPFMRVNPIVGWDYGHVWEFLRGWQLPFCVLYEQGYTSLGKRARTQRNPALRQPDGTYLPAWDLSDGLLERAGREGSPAIPVAAAVGVPDVPNAAGALLRTGPLLRTEITIESPPGSQEEHRAFMTTLGLLRTALPADIVVNEKTALVDAEENVLATPE